MMRTWIRDNGLSLVLFGLFALTIVGHALTGWVVMNDERTVNHAAPLAFIAYLHTGAFLSSVFENWESEFLQMGVYVVLTAYLFQRGSPESKDPDKPAPQDRDPKLDKDNPAAPWLVRAGGFARAAYAHSLGMALGFLFLASFAVHAFNSARHAREQAQVEGTLGPSLLAHLSSAEFWFESFQNWQSEFLSTAVLIVLAVFLRERGSPESKPVSAPHAQTGTD
jgi:hypothetical protein